MNQMTTNNDKIIIDPNFKALIPPLMNDEFAGLEASILSEGCRDALVIWKNNGAMVLLDGHNRFSICKRLNLPFKTLELHFNSEPEALIWIIGNQLNRRNLTQEQRIYFIGKRYLLDRKSKGGQLKNKNAQKKQIAPLVPVVLTSDITTPQSTAHRIADETKLSHKTVKIAGKYATAIDRIR